MNFNSVTIRLCNSINPLHSGVAYLYTMKTCFLSENAVG